MLIRKEDNRGGVRYGYRIGPAGDTRLFVVTIMPSSRVTGYLVIADPDNRRPTPGARVRLERSLNTGRCPAVLELPPSWKEQGHGGSAGRADRRRDVVIASIQKGSHEA